MDVPGKLKQIDIALRKCKDPTERTALMIEVLDLIFRELQLEVDCPGSQDDLDNKEVDGNHPSL
ncbi:hypothetical protein [Phaeodactylibacter xiamenensis]|uniref:hypothetical protein n=1 Tax=Phaeodactylibacter xiamenensis TaxID=1524460 RepID=UPI003CCB76F0